jgi:histidyl-tRNA synthetase
MQKMPKPVKLYYFANCFRYERSQAGRYREFYQAGVESIGSGNPETDAEVIALAVKTLENLGLENFTTSIGHIGVLRGILEKEGVSEKEQNTLMGIIDKGEKAALEAALEKFSGESREMLMELIELKGDPKDVLDKALKLLKEKEKITELEETLEFLESFGVADHQVNLGIARGLDYYTGIVFEIYAEGLGAQDQVCGGGNYTLTEAFGGQKTATSGFAFGFDRVMLALEAQGALHEERDDIEYLVVPKSDDLRKKAIEISTKIRENSNCEVDIMRRNLSKALSYADKRSISYVIIVSEDEVLKRDMKTGKQEKFEI